MNRRMVIYTVGQIVKIEAALLCLPIIVSLIFGESCVWAFIITAALALVLGFALTLLSHPKNKVIYAKEGFVIVAFAWMLMSLVGALPFTICGEIPNYVDAVFETVSGFTTTGSSILTDIDSLSRGVLFWRSFTHWVGGMGVLVFVMALIPSVSDRSIHIMRAEVPGPIVGKLVPKIKDTAKILYLIYIGITVTEVILLMCGGMPLFDSLLNAFGTAGTGGFAICNAGTGSYTPYVQWVITAFMFLFGINFNVYYLLLLGRIKNVLKSAELWTYIGIFVVACGIITWNIMSIYQSFGEAIRLSAFQSASILTTTGFSTADFNLWPELSKSVLFILMFIGGCAGSTAGGLKVTRVMMLFKAIRREVKRILHPRSVSSVKFEGKALDNQTIGGVMSYFAIYCGCMVVIFVLLSFEQQFGVIENLTATVSCFNNIGPGLGAIGPASNFAGYSAFGKILLSLAMLLGRLEIYPILITLTPSTWSKK